MSEQSVHGTAITLAGRGVLLRGAPGSGKSSLALRLIDSPGLGLGDQLLRARLIADDQVYLRREADKIFLSAPQNLQGLLEVRGLGIQTLSFCTTAQLHLVVDLRPCAEIIRLPDAEDQTVGVCGCAIKRVFVDAHSAAAPAILRAALY